MKYRILSALWSVLWIGLWLGTASDGSAQTITLTSPTTAQQIADGDDFFTSVAGEPCDLDIKRDIPFDLYNQEPTLSSGIWSATYLQAGSVFYPLFEGYSIPSYTNYNYFFTDGMPYGPLIPLDASRYTALSMRQSLPESVRATMTVAWTTHANYDVAAASNSIAFIDADYLGAGYYDYFDSGFRIYNLPVTPESAWTNERVDNAKVTAPAIRNGSWSGTIYGLFVQPTSGGAAGTESKVDWIRIYNPNTSRTLRLTWSTTGLPLSNATNDALYSIQLWVNSSASTSGGDLLVSLLKNDGSYDLKTAALPPGNYYFYLKAVQATVNGFTTLATSGLSPLVTILAPPVLEFTSPSFTSGADYASTVLGNPWDMSDSSDIFEQAHVTAVSFGGGYMAAYADPPANGATESDAQFRLNTRLNGTDMPIDTTKYRYLTYRMIVDSTGYTNINDRVARGWVSRFIAFNADIGADGTEFQGMPIFEDAHTYTIDLWDRNAMETINPYPKQVGWREAGTYKFLRFDPLEVPQYTLFYIDDVKLCADNTPQHNVFNLGWTAADADSASLSITLAYGSLSGTNFSGTTIATVTQAPGAGSYAWDTVGVAAGSYYIRATVSDGSNAASFYSDVPVTVSATASGAHPLAGDYDGDGKADPGTFANGTWTLYLSGSGYQASTLSYGASGACAALGDIDGDRKGDPTVSYTVNGYWYLWFSASGYQQAGPYDLSDSGYLPLIGDFDGDGAGDPAVAYGGSWYIYLSGSGYAALGPLSFGAAGMTPVVGDFDGDGYCDLAGCDSSGYWYIWMSRAGYQRGGPYAMGPAGGTPVAADFDGDRYADPAMYLAGSWYFYLSGAGYARMGPLAL